MHSRLKLTQGSKINKEKNKHKHYKRVHEDDKLEDNNDNSSNHNTFLFPAAESDNLGWNPDSNYFDPMYTISRRNRENNVKDKDAFFKKLRMRLEGTGADTPEQNVSKHNSLNHDKDLPTGSVAAAAAVAKTVVSKDASDKKTSTAGLMGFGFSMMGNMDASQQIVTEQTKDKKKKSKDRKDKEKKKSKKS
ncbi:hypothetical protein H4R24_000444 [Coemansia sp. RSA 988]|nr:hypothetical protein H4R24_000444 [Coemansia sp. RSA 988]